MKTLEELDIRTRYSEYSRELGSVESTGDFDSVDFVRQRAAAINGMNKCVEELAEWMHDNYEEISQNENWNTQESCKVKFEELPEENKKVMIELSRRILNQIT